MDTIGYQRFSCRVGVQKGSPQKMTPDDPFVPSGKLT